MISYNLLANKFSNEDFCFLTWGTWNELGLSKSVNHSIHTYSRFSIQKCIIPSIWKNNQWEIERWKLKSILCLPGLL